MTATLRHYVCGSTVHDPAAMFHGGTRGIRTFPSGVFLYDDPDNGRRVLFDTGYATGDWNTGWRGAVYRRLLPPVVAAGDDVAERLRADGIDPVSVTHVVLSHLHPDHVGGVRRFPDAIFVVSAALMRSMASPRLRDGILTGLLPDWFPAAPKIVLDEEAFVRRDRADHEYRAADLFGDGSYLVVDLPGHAAGHVGALIEDRVLLAGDAAWGSDLLDVADLLRPVPRAVQYDYSAYRRTVGMLRAFADSGIRVVCSHDAQDDRELIG